MCLNKGSEYYLTAHVRVVSQVSLFFKDWNCIWGCF